MTDTAKIEIFPPDVIDKITKPKTDPNKILKALYLRTIRIFCNGDYTVSTDYERTTQPSGFIRAKCKNTIMLLDHSTTTTHSSEDSISQKKELSITMTQLVDLTFMYTSDLDEILLMAKSKQKLQLTYILIFDPVSDVVIRPVPLIRQTHVPSPTPREVASKIVTESIQRGFLETRSRRDIEQVVVEVTKLFDQTSSYINFDPVQQDNDRNEILCLNIFPIHVVDVLKLVKYLPSPMCNIECRILVDTTPQDNCLVGGSGFTCMTLYYTISHLDRITMGVSRTTLERLSLISTTEDTNSTDYIPKRIKIHNKSH